jgi:tetratricopeptide (TPR) repeat protein
MAALEAAEAAGVDRRGRQPAAMVAERRGGGREGVERILDLRADDHPEPIEGLRRPFGIRDRRHAALASDALDEAGGYDGALAETDRALERLGDDPFLRYDRACYASLAGRRDEALEALARTLELDPSMRKPARADRDFFSLAHDSEFLRLTAQAESSV